MLLCGLEASNFQGRSRTVAPHPILLYAFLYKTLSIILTFKKIGQKHVSLQPLKTAKYSDFYTSFTCSFDMHEYRVASKTRKTLEDSTYKTPTCVNETGT